jgi:hypothetical protein
MLAGLLLGAEQSTPAVRPTLLQTLLRDCLLLFEQKAPVYITIRIPPPGSRRQTLLSRLI